MVEPAGPQLETVRVLLVEYAESIAVDLCFQGFDEELAGLPGAYAPPGGRLWLALAGGEPLGCVALRATDEAGIAELKRLYVRPAARGTGLGRRLAELAVAAARELGYARLRLDTMPSMAAAIGIYRRLGFREIAPYRFNPVEDARFFELDLASG